MRKLIMAAVSCCLVSSLSAAVEITARGTEPGKIKSAGIAELPVRLRPSVTDKSRDGDMASFDALAACFDEGRAPAPEEVTGWFSGMEYVNNGTVKSALVITEPADLQASPKTMYMGVWDSTNLSAYKGMNTQAVSDMKGRYLRSRKLAQLDDKELSQSLPGANGHVSVIAVRVCRGYLVDRFTVDGNIFSYAYYDQDITP